MTIEFDHLTTPSKGVVLIDGTRYSVSSSTWYAVRRTMVGKPSRIFLEMPAKIGGRYFRGYITLPASANNL